MTEVIVTASFSPDCSPDKLVKLLLVDLYTASKDVSCLQCFNEEKPCDRRQSCLALEEAISVQDPQLVQAQLSGFRFSGVDPTRPVCLRVQAFDKSSSCADDFTQTEQTPIFCAANTLPAYPSCSNILIDPVCAPPVSCSDPTDPTCKVPFDPMMDLFHKCQLKPGENPNLPFDAGWPPPPMDGAVPADSTTPTP